MRPSTVTAALVGPDGVPRVLESGVAHPPGTYPFTFAPTTSRGPGTGEVQATDDLGRVSTVDQAFRYDTTLKGSPSRRRARARVVRFAL